MCAGGTRRRVKVCALQTAAYEPRKITRRLRSSTLIFGMNEITHAASSLSAIISQRVKVICWVDSALSGAEQPPDALCHHVRAVCVFPDYTSQEMCAYLWAHFATHAEKDARTV